MILNALLLLTLTVMAMLITEARSDEMVLYAGAPTPSPTASLVRRFYRQAPAPAPAPTSAPPPGSQVTAMTKKAIPGGGTRYVTTYRIRRPAPANPVTTTAMATGAIAGVAAGAAVTAAGQVAGAAGQAAQQVSQASAMVHGDHPVMSVSPTGERLYTYALRGSAADLFTLVMNFGRPRSAQASALLQFNVLVDTGSSEIWVASTDCKGGLCDGHPMYNPSESSANPQIMEPKRKSITYGSGTVSFVRDVTDDVIIQTTGLSASIAVRHRFCLVSDVSGTDLFTSSANLTRKDGIIGFAPTKSNIAYVMYQSGLITSPTWSFHMRGPRRVQPGSAGGHVVFGGSSPQHMTQAPVHVKAELGPNWYLPLVNVTIQDAKRHIIRSNAPKGDFRGRAQRVWVDSGVNALITPSALIFHNLHISLGFQPVPTAPDTWRVKCSRLSKIPFLQIHLEGIILSLNGKDITYDAGGGWCNSWLRKPKTDNPDPSWVLGSPVLHAYASVWKLDTNGGPISIGFAPAAGGDDE
ncbi:aspartic peptidase domain-containing protein [Piptocephalis cylindrospora]|uniref:Aspartic peptidase domain-containing protein n=1 Tax=Piptocephalis cylindrospora TaxID=1907219 RepID=A0A4P9Y5W5_9FUNG|nr:aspartic peptidase domain-containing protein [Piptocephalis cylindrospora]|eukprot:RKP14436.1 aspartic peptidase domain-containing protein [Piptocephalis cylindrospora]